MTTPQLGMDELETGQGEPEVTINTAMRTLEATLQLTVLDKDLTTPPASPAATARYIVAAGATAEWAGQANRIAFLLNSVWEFLTPREGWLAHVDDENTHYKYNGTAWELFAGAASLTVYDISGTTSSEVNGVTEIQFDNALVEQIATGVARVTPLGSGSGTADEGHGTRTTITSAAGVATMDHSLGADFMMTLGENIATFNHSNLTSGDSNWFSLELKQDGTGGRTFAPPASWTYPSGVSAYTPSTGAGDIDLVQGITYDNGTTWRISYEKDFT